MSLAMMAACNSVLVTNVVARFDPFQCTTEFETNCEPVAVKVKSPPPAKALLGAIKLKVGAGLLMVKVNAFDVPPPGEGLKTVTWKVPLTAMSLAEIVAVSWLLLTNVVVRSALFQRTTEPEMKPVPVTISVKAASPAAVLFGESETICGTGLVVCVGAPLPPPHPVPTRIKAPTSKWGARNCWRMTTRKLRCINPSRLPLCEVLVDDPAEHLQGLRPADRGALHHVARLRRHSRDVGEPDDRRSGSGDSCRPSRKPAEVPPVADLAQMRLRSRGECMQPLHTTPIRAS